MCRDELLVCSLSAFQYYGLIKDKHAYIIFPSKTARSETFVSMKGVCRGVGAGRGVTVTLRVSKQRFEW